MQVVPDLKEIRRRRERLGISQHKLAKDLRISQSTVAKIESGKINPTYKLVERIFSHLSSLHSVGMGTAGEVASKPVLAVREGTSVAVAVKTLQKHGFKQLPVLNGNHNLGSLSERGISRRILETKRPELLLRQPVGTVMEEALPTLSEDVAVEVIIPLLQQTQAVLTSKKGRITGIVTNADLLKLIQKLSPRLPS